MLILLLIAVFLLAALALLGWALAGYALRIRPQTLEEARRSAAMNVWKRCRRSTMT